MLTLFAAISLPDHIQNYISPLQTGIEGIRWQAPQKLHITLGYFGAQSEDMAEILDLELAKSPGPAFDIRLTAANVFGGERPHALWFGVQEWGGLTALNHHVRKAARRAKIDMESRKFTPHVTLAYINSGTDLADVSRFLQRHQTFTSRPFLVDEFSLFSSHRVKNAANHYIREANYPLTG